MYSRSHFRDLYTKLRHELLAIEPSNSLLCLPIDHHELVAMVSGENPKKPNVAPRLSQLWPENQPIWERFEPEDRRSILRERVLEAFSAEIQDARDTQRVIVMANDTPRIHGI